MTDSSKDIETQPVEASENFIKRFRLGLGIGVVIVLILVTALVVLFSIGAFADLSTAPDKTYSTGCNEPFLDVTFHDAFSSSGAGFISHGESEGASDCLDWHITRVSDGFKGYDTFASDMDTQHGNDDYTVLDSIHPSGSALGSGDHIYALVKANDSGGSDLFANRFIYDGSDFSFNDTDNVVSTADGNIKNTYQNISQYHIDWSHDGTNIAGVGSTFEYAYSYTFSGFRTEIKFVDLDSNTVNTWDFQDLLNDINGKIIGWEIDKTNGDYIWVVDEHSDNELYLIDLQASTVDDLIADKLQLDGFGIAMDSAIGTGHIGVITSNNWYYVVELSDVNDINVVASHDMSGDITISPDLVAIHDTQQAISVGQVGQNNVEHFRYDINNLMDTSSVGNPYAMDWSEDTFNQDNDFGVLDRSDNQVEIWTSPAVLTTDPAIFNFESTSVTPDPVFRDNSYRINYEITNDGGESDTQTIELYIDGSLDSSEDITLASGETTNSFFQFDGTEFSQGSHSYEIQSENDAITGSYNIRSNPLEFPLDENLYDVNWINETMFAVGTGYGDIYIYTGVTSNNTSDWDSIPIEISQPTIVGSDPVNITALDVNPTTKNIAYWYENGYLAVAEYNGGESWSLTEIDGDYNSDRPENVRVEYIKNAETNGISPAVIMSAYDSGLDYAVVNPSNLNDNSIGSPNLETLIDMGCSYDRNNCLFGIEQQLNNNYLYFKTWRSGGTSYTSSETNIESPSQPGQFYNILDISDGSESIGIGESGTRYIRYNGDFDNQNSWKKTNESNISLSELRYNQQNSILGIGLSTGNYSAINLATNATETTLDLNGDTINESSWNTQNDLVIIHNDRRNLSVFKGNETGLDTINATFPESIEFIDEFANPVDQILILYNNNGFWAIVTALAVALLGTVLMRNETNGNVDTGTTFMLLFVAGLLIIYLLSEYIGESWLPWYVIVIAVLASLFGFFVKLLSTRR